MDADARGGTYVLHGAAPQPRRRDLPPWGWSWEVLALIASVGCMASIVAVLITMKDRPQTGWTFFFSIPATLAVFGTAAKSTAAFAVGACISQYKWLHFKRGPRKLTDLDMIEEASRGPLGSVVLLFKRPMALASIGAIVTLLALAMDVFVQQMVEFTPLGVFVDDSTAVLGLAHSYDGGAEPYREKGELINVKAYTSDTSMQGAVFRGLFNLGSTPVFNCTSNCHWNGTYVSLGFASTCADVTEATIQLHPNATGTWSGTMATNREDMNLTTPGGVKLRADYAYTSWQTVVSVGAISLLNASQLTADLLPGSDGIRMSPEIARIAVFRVPVNSSSIFTLSDIEVVECDIGLAAYRYTNVSSLGTELTATKQETIRLEQGLVDVSSGWADMLIFNQSGLPVLSASVPDLTALHLLFISKRFTGTIFDGESIPADPQGMGDAFRSGNMSQTIQNMADSMTDQLRSSYTVKAAGQSTQQIVFVQVQWAWLALPVVVVLVSVVFVLIVLVESGRAMGLPLWKSSTTALLTHDVRFGEENGEQIGKLGTGVRSMKELDAFVDSITARLEVPESYSIVPTASGSEHEGYAQGMKLAH